MASSSYPDMFGSSIVSKSGNFTEIHNANSGLHVHGAGVHVHLPMKRWGTTKVQAGGGVPSRTALTAW